MLVAELVPEVMEVFIMRTEDYVAESGSFMVSYLVGTASRITLLV